MLSTAEKVIFIIAILVSLSFGYRIALRMSRVIQRGRGTINRAMARHRLIHALIKTFSLQPTWQTRKTVSLLHAFVAWAFIFYLLVNLVDILEGFISDFNLTHSIGILGDLFRFSADLLSIAALLGMSLLLIRRFVFNPADLKTREDILLNEKARTGIRRDSAIVGIFILIHVGARFLGQSIFIALEGNDPWQPFASMVASIWGNSSESTLIIGLHFSFWLALGTILLFIPYFLYSKHIHLLIAPLNFLLKPNRRSIGELEEINFEDESLEQFGATNIEDLGWEQIMDSYACIMCYRCQVVCPAYNTGKVLSPAALEINKRYFLNQEGARIANGDESSRPLLESVISPEAIWACTACGACIEICPVGNEPMRDIMEIRRAMVLMDNNFPEQFQAAFRGMERNTNPWNISPSDRLDWAKDLEVPTIEARPNPEILWWVGCAPATDPRAQKTARSFANILNNSGIDYAVLGDRESCTGDSARRAGNEYLFYELALNNIDTLNQVSPDRIVTTCPHCLHTLKNEYPAYGGNYTVIHHSQLIDELISENKISVDLKIEYTLTYHDPCYLGRQNDIESAPRNVLTSSGESLIEMANYGNNSFCCGAGGAQMWKEEEHGLERVNQYRFRQAQETQADVLSVGCPFCIIMLNDARKDANSDMKILDIAEVVEEKMEIDNDSDKR